MRYFAQKSFFTLLLKTLDYYLLYSSELELLAIYKQLASWFSFPWGWIFDRMFYSFACFRLLKFVYFVTFYFYASYLFTWGCFYNFTKELLAVLRVWCNEREFKEWNDRFIRGIMGNPLFDGYLLYISQ